MIITNIQRFSLHDGPGIRTTVFVKGCLLRCPWCSNPENINFQIEEYIKENKVGIYGKDYSIDEIFREITRDINYYGKDGGVTFSGGEPLLFSDIITVSEMCRKKGISTAVETSLFIPEENLLKAISYFDYFLVDLKVLDANNCKYVIKGNIDTFFHNFELLVKRKKVSIRIPVIGGFTDSGLNKKMIIGFLKEHKESIYKIELIKGHNLGNSKYLSLGIPIPKFQEINNQDLFEYQKSIENNTGIKTDICKI